MKIVFSLLAAIVALAVVLSNRDTSKARPQTLDRLNDKIDQVSTPGQEQRRDQPPPIPQSESPSVHTPPQPSYALGEVIWDPMTLPERDRAFFEAYPLQEHVILIKGPDDRYGMLRASWKRSNGIRSGMTHEEALESERLAEFAEALALEQAMQERIVRKLVRVGLGRYCANEEQASDYTRSVNKESSPEDFGCLRVADGAGYAVVPVKDYKADEEVQAMRELISSLKDTLAPNGQVVNYSCAWTQPSAYTKK